MTLFQVRTNYSDDYFFWADNADEARKMFIEYTTPSESEHIFVDRVWANNKDSRFRGYVVKD